MIEDKAERTLRLIDCMKQSLAHEEKAEDINGPPEPEQSENVIAVDFAGIAKEKFRETAMAMDVTPREVLEVALADLDKLEGVTKCYITLICDRKNSWATNNYRANLTRAEEIAFRQIAMAELIDSWRGIDYEPAPVGE